MKSHLFLFLFSLLLSFSCTNDTDDTVNYDVQNEADIIKYIAKHKLLANRTDTGLYYVIDEIGMGKKPTSSSEVTVSYKGYFLDGTTFDQSDAKGISFKLQQVIDGWTEGLTYFKEGGSGMLLIPSRLAYGNTGNSRIPGGAVLIFEIKLLKVN
ncbi:FKBP-type peptidyl-prolyl cis-trans isomerase [Tenacibaculum maritimum]|uniref:Peptidyl-prolyl cis-trans isomerase n=1 Tax=Tenacibaculum maritimum NCIMB 2154 TaxID=1349785 RepID=A0A2H1E7J6_9FLAO|nr:FKBP-type peptidyl-prolyl cis-trans isomerase [Tenacibaculum maritimum]MCD9620745.1 FKBP-type peptidyl-prolyl cis-trans isomerase [Tenacibaculum maritimum]MCD9627487.1 FKBP-type peptidyl-prolyl cis-trans isomerase [Tenacibaculum maritimum]MCD9630526.1 FKBP-type peptidyl-prolyl cis-trans isomerase [Tenacibaculum maritimum]MCD9632565.1 FKBP-type peptidyl-prolyl cis-trans isomerase [Tenacibaculum maritimum]CAA0147336.1 Peptidyl-prolyl cis-trans isomerase precursor [Tenacibaculum maritimum]